VGENKKIKVVNSRSDRAKVCRKRRQKQPPKKGLGDRQVGAFSVFGVGVYRNPVHILAKKGLKIKKSSDLGVDVIQPRSRPVS